MLTASLVVDLSREPLDDERSDRQVLDRAHLRAAPDRTRVDLLVGSRWPTVDSWVIGELHAQAGRLCIDIRGNDVKTISRWREAVLRGNPWTEEVA